MITNKVGKDIEGFWEEWIKFQYPGYINKRNFPASWIEDFEKSLAKEKDFVMKMLSNYRQSLLTEVKKKLKFKKIGKNITVGDVNWIISSVIDDLSAE